MCLSYIHTAKQICWPRVVLCRVFYLVFAAPDFAEVGERGRHGEQPRGVGEVEARGGAAAQREHGRVVRARGGLGGDLGPEPEPLAALAGDAHLADPPAGAAPAPHAAVHRVPRLLELGAPRGALRVRGRGGGRGTPLLGAGHVHCCRRLDAGYEVLWMWMSVRWQTSLLSSSSEC